MSESEVDQATSKPTPNSRQRVLWFIGLYSGGVFIVAGLSYALRALVIS